MSFELMQRIRKLEERVTYLERRLDSAAKAVEPIAPPVRQTLHLPEKKSR